MKGLILKDIYTISKQMRFFLIFIIFFCVFPKFQLSTFGIVYTSMLPLTALAYDEHYKWNQLARTMPFSQLDIVLSKYILSYILVLAATVLTYVCQTIIGFFTNSPVALETVAILLFTDCAAFTLLAVVLPIMFKLGVEKGRIFFILIMGFVVFTVMLTQDKIMSLLNSITLNLTSITLAIIIFTVVINIASIFISSKIEKQK